MFRTHRLRLLQVQSLIAVLICFACPAWAGFQATKLLSAETDVFITINLRELLYDYRDIEFVQRYLDQWRLAVKGDESQLLEHYELQEIHKYEGISRKEFLERAGMIKTACDAFEIDPFEDVDLITVGYTAGDPGLPAIVVEGRFKLQNTVQLEQFFHQHLFPVNQGDGPALGLLDHNTLVFAGSKKTLEAIRARAGAMKSDMPSGVRTLLESGRKSHLSVVVNNLDTNVQRLMKFAGEQLAGSLGTDHAISKLILGKGTAWIKQSATEYAAASFSVSVQDAESQLEFGMDAKNIQQAESLRTLIDIGSFWGVQALTAIDHDLARPAAGILGRKRVTLKDTTLFVQIDLPDGFVSQAKHHPSFDFFPDLQKVNANPNPFPGKPELQSLASQVTSIPLWKPEVSSAEIVEVRGEPYKTGPGTDPFRHRLDMFLPKNKKNFPMVVLVHGGGWDTGDNRCAGLYSSVGQFLASQGIGVVLPNYRLSPNVKHPEHIKDVACAVAWTRSQAGKYGGDVQRLYLLGHSAGGHLVALLAADESYLKAEGMSSADIKGVIAFSGVYRISEGVMYGSLAGSGPQALRIEQMLPLRGEYKPFWNWHPPGVHVAPDIFGPAFGESSKQRADASPITHVRRDMPPFLILSPEYEMPTLGPLADEFHAALRDKGCDARLLRVPKRNHNSLMFSAITTQDPAARAILEFVLK
ncbi:MAG: nlhH 1 [Planctomycetaceae bacterium]|nr:nlhH 1 [Planctomycetaceae bacterium]